MRINSFRMKILICTWALILVALVPMFYYSMETVEESLVRETRERAGHELQAVQWLIQEHESFASVHELDQWVKGLGARLGIRITYIADGRVQADTSVAFRKLSDLDDHATRPEILALDDGDHGESRRYSSTLNKEMLYVATRVESVAGLKGGVLRLAVPFSEISQRLGDIRNNIYWIFGLILVALALLSTGLSRTLTGGIGTFSGLVTDIGGGDYGRRINEFPSKEFQPLAEAVNTMASKIQTHIATIEGQRGQLEAMFEGMNEGVMVLDANGRIESFNGAMLNMYPSVAGATGRTPLEATLNLEVQDAVDVLNRNQDMDRIEAKTELNDGRFFEISAVQYTDRSDVGRMILVFRDVTEIRKSHVTLRDFVANASHQLRTPLTSIRGYAETLREMPPEDSKESRRFLEIIEKNAAHMNEVVSGLLTLATSESKKSKGVLKPVNAFGVLDRAISDLAPKAAEKKVQFKTDMPGDGLTVVAESEGLLHVFHNLLDNAIRYSPKNSVIMISSGHNEGKVLFRITDQGPGLSRELGEKVFERFFRADENSVEGTGNAGLGLAICRQIVRNFGGDIWYQATIDGGAQFCFTLESGSDDHVQGSE